MRALDAEDLIDKAAKMYLCEGIVDFTFSIRKKAAIRDFYQRLEREVSEQNVFNIRSFRRVREGNVLMPRPAVLGLTLNSLLAIRPELAEQKKIIDMALDRNSFVDVQGFIKLRYQVLTKGLSVLLQSLDVFNYILENRERVKGLLLRQVPHGQSTKLLGKEPLLLALYRFYKEEPLLSWEDFYQEFGLIAENLEFRFFAPCAEWRGIELEFFHGVLSTTLQEAWRFPLRSTLIVENYQSFLALSEISKTTLIIWGQGWKVSQIVELLSRVPTPIRYWGDLDKEGLEIFEHLSQKMSGAITPLLMDMNTLKAHQHLAQKVSDGEAVEKKDHFVLSEVYSTICRQGIRIEQEQICWPQDWDI